ncbi:MAG: IS110 family transposase [Holosporaceae bacterium]|jgi:hypothetical protein|nr:IS110 family transposase [Holosporaceae bacterium]
MQKQVVGIDISKKILDVCAIFSDQVKRKKFMNTEK